MNKKGLTAMIVDFTALMFLMLFIIAMIMIFKLSIKPYQASLAQASIGPMSFMTVRNVLQSEVEYEGMNVSLGDLIVVCGANNGCRTDTDMIEFIEEAFDKSLTAYNMEPIILGVRYGPTRTIWNEKKPEGDCEVQGGTVKLAPFGPVTGFDRSRYNHNLMGVNVTIVYCQHG